MKPRAMKKKPVAMKRGGKKMMRGGMAKKPTAMKSGGRFRGEPIKAKAGPKGFTKKGSGKTTRSKPAKSKMQMLKDAAKKAGKKLF